MLPTVNKFSPASRSKPEPLSFDIYLEHDSSAAMNARLTVEFIKLLCFQKGLIPVTCNQLSSRLVSIRQHSISLEDVSLMKSKEKMKAMKKRRCEMLFSRKGECFMNDLNNLTESVTSCFIDENPRVTIILGKSVFTPKEVYVMDWSSWQQSYVACDDSSSLQKNQMNFFRFLITCDDLLPIMEPMPLTNLTVLCETESRSLLGFFPRLNFHVPERGRRITFRMLNRQNHQQSTGISRRLFSSSSLARLASRNDLDLSGVSKLEDEEFECGQAKKFWYQATSVLRGFYSKF